MLKAKDASVWAKGEVDDDRPYLARYLFLTGLWRAVLPDDETWQADDPATQRILAKGASPRDLGAVIRQAQCDLLYEVCQLIDNPAHGIEDLHPRERRLGLCEVDANERPTGRVILDLHASVARFDPTGRDGQPPDKTPPKRRPRRR